MASERERFCQVLSNGRLVPGDAIVVLTGDGEQRVRVAYELFKQGAAPIVVVTGGYDNPPHSLPASTLAGRLMGMGLSASRIKIDSSAMHTQDQAINVLTMAEEFGWKRLLLVASPYHAARSFLTFLKVVEDAGKADDIHIIAVPAGMYIPWFKCPDGREETRTDLLAEEYDKIERYGAQGHVASYATGLQYLRRWEQAA